MYEENGMIFISRKDFESIIKDKNDKIKELEYGNKMLRNALIQLTKNKKDEYKDVEISRNDFIKMHNEAVECMFDKVDSNDDDDIYGYDFTIHWHGVFCNCGDGATPANLIVPGIQDCEDELGYYE